MIKRVKSLSKIGFILILTSFLFLSFPGYSEEGLKQSSMNFTGVAKKAVPAVVSIQVKTPVRQKGIYFRKGQQHEYENPFDFFGDNFFQHFFGAPRRHRAAGSGDGPAATGG